MNDEREATQFGPLARLNMGYLLTAGFGVQSRDLYVVLVAGGGQWLIVEVETVTVSVSFSDDECDPKSRYYSIVSDISVMVLMSRRAKRLRFHCISLKLLVPNRYT